MKYLISSCISVFLYLQHKSMRLILVANCCFIFRRLSYKFPRPVIFTNRLMVVVMHKDFKQHSSFALLPDGKVR